MHFTQNSTCTYLSIWVWPWNVSKASETDQTGESDRLKRSGTPPPFFKAPRSTGESCKNSYEHLCWPHTVRLLEKSQNTPAMAHTHPHHNVHTPMPGSLVRHTGIRTLVGRLATVGSTTELHARSRNAAHCGMRLTTMWQALFLR